MFRSIATVLSVALTLQLTLADSAIDISQHNNVQLELDSNNVVPKTKLLDVNPEERSPVFIGDLIAGKRYADETIFRRVIEFNNPTNTIQSTTLDVSISSGVIHFISARNVQGSQAVVCASSSTLGSNKTSVNLRAPPNSLAKLTLTVAAHEQTA